MITRPAIFKWRQTEPGFILFAVRWYLRYSLSLRDVEELLEERGLNVDHATVWACNNLCLRLTVATLPLLSSAHQEGAARRAARLARWLTTTSSNRSWSEDLTNKS